MQQSRPHGQKPSQYAKITLDKRLKLASLVLDQQLSIGKSAKKLGIKLSTAKLIMKKYKEEGTFFESRKDRKERLENRETQLEAPMEYQQHHMENTEDNGKWCNQVPQICYLVDGHTGIIYFTPCYTPIVGLYQ